MYRLKPSLVLLPLVFVLTLTGCRQLEPLEFRKINNVKVEQKPGGGYAVTADLGMYNPNSKKFVIESADIEVYIDEAFLGKLNLPDEVIIPREAEFNAACSIDIKMNNILSVGLGVLSKLRKGEVNARFKGTIKARYMFSSKIIQVDAVQKLKTD